MRSLAISATGMTAQQQRVDTIANNIANVNTPGYRKAIPLFQDLIYQNERSVGAPTSAQTSNYLPSGVLYGLGVRLASVIHSHNPGTISKTDRALDLMIEGRGYFQIDKPDGQTYYTRAGTFEINPDGKMITPEGYTLNPQITIPDGTLEITINASGQVFAKLSNQVALQNVGQIDLATFPNPGGLRPAGDNLYEQTSSSGSPTTSSPGTNGVGTLLQGFLESSNVNIITELTELISAQRAYEFNSKVMETTNEMMATINRQRS